MEWLITNGGGAPSGSINMLGEDFVLGWSLYRGVLTLSPVKGAISPWVFRVKPWARVSTAPSARFLSKRCLLPAGALSP
jgi:hypothetical protein